MTKLGRTGTEGLRDGRGKLKGGGKVDKDD